ncbi:MAG: hypothetical protein IT553_03085 [Sphingomonadaceae bacterium]|nr:hypothetical protein [Sphingomonadaceae bacterium]
MLRQLRAALGHGATVSLMHERRWASATFTGMRHYFSVRLAAAGGDALLDALGDHIFRLSGLLVADCHVPRRERDGDMLAAEVEMLTVALD